MYIMIEFSLPFTRAVFEFNHQLTWKCISEIQTNGSGGVGTNSQNASNRSEILYMSAVLGRLTNQLPDQVLTLLNEAVDAHFKLV